LQRTLSVLGWSLFAGAAFTTAVGALLGLYASRRVLLPLREFSHAAEEVGRGHLQTRLSVGKDPDLAAFCDAFNEMAEALEHRTERDARFASDVSHELRNPLTALTAAVDVLGNRADERTRSAVEIVRSQVVHFQQLVLDLLELSRLDAGQTELRIVEIDPRKYFPSAVNTNVGEAEVVVDDSVPRLLYLDQRRVAQILTNLLDNANRHGGGVTRVEITATGSALQIAVEDDGPGVPDHERSLIFDRFRRGSRFGETTRGSGLGLAIVAEHCRAHGGEARMEQRGGGGARFVAVVRVRGRR
jgi:two-component system, OmpR family, sensor histidine kinase MtrB